MDIPDYNIEKQADFVFKTNNLFESIESTLLVKAAHNFNELDLDLINKQKTQSKILQMKSEYKIHFIGYDIV